MYGSGNDGMSQALKSRRGKGVSLTITMGEDMAKDSDKNDDLAPSGAPVPQSEGNLDAAKPRTQAGTVGVHPVNPVMPDHTFHHDKDSVMGAGGEEMHKSEDYAHMPGDMAKVMAETDKDMIGEMGEYEKGSLAGREPKSLGERARKMAMERMVSKK